MARVPLARALLATPTNVAAGGGRGGNGASVALVVPGSTIRVTVGPGRLTDAELERRYARMIDCVYTDVDSGFGSATLRKAVTQYRDYLRRLANQDLDDDE